MHTLITDSWQQLTTPWRNFMSCPNLTLPSPFAKTRLGRHTSIYFLYVCRTLEITQQTARATFFLSPCLHSFLCYQSLRFMKIGVGCLGVGLCSTLKWDSDFSHYFLIYFLFHSGVNIFWQWFDIVGWASWKVICLARTANPMFGECFPPLPFFLHFHQQKLPRDDKV